MNFFLISEQFDAGNPRKWLFCSNLFSQVAQDHVMKLSEHLDKVASADTLEKSVEKVQKKVQL